MKKIDKWINKNCGELKNKTIAITGASGDLGKETCDILASLGANLILLDRNVEKSNKLKSKLKEEYPQSTIENIIVDLEDFSSVEKLCDILDNINIDYLILNAGAYNIKRKTTSLGYDNVYQINFISQYYIANRVLKNMKKNNKGKIIVVSSIASNYSKIDTNDIEFKNKKKSSLVYGNSKRFLTFSMYELFKNETNIKLAIVHPGISYTNITAHYPKIIFKLIKYPMKIIFSKPRKACLSIVLGIFSDCRYHEWIGPKIFNIWGLPMRKKVKYCKTNESYLIGKITKKIIEDIDKSKL